MSRGPFEPTHRLIRDVDGISQLRMGLLLRQGNPYAGSKDLLRMYDEDDWNRGSRKPWLLYGDDLEPLPQCEEILQRMRDEIAKKAGWTSFS